MHATPFPTLLQACCVCCALQGRWVVCVWGLGWRGCLVNAWECWRGGCGIGWYWGWLVGGDMEWVGILCTLIFELSHSLILPFSSGWCLKNVQR